MTYSTTPEMLDRVDRLSSYNGIVRGVWQGHDDQGREIACWLGALDPAIDSIDACPATVMPGWLAHITPALDDSVSDSAWAGFWERYRALLRRWHVLDEAAWRRCDLRTRDAALTIAEPHDDVCVVAPVRALIARELAGEIVGASEWMTANTAAMATMSWASRTARMVQEAAAEAAAMATRHCAASASSAWAAAVVSAASCTAAEDFPLQGIARRRRAAWDRIADACLSSIEAECDAATRDIPSEAAGSEDRRETSSSRHPTPPSGQDLSPFP